MNLGSLIRVNEDPGLKRGVPELSGTHRVGLRAVLGPRQADVVWEGVEGGCLQSDMQKNSSTSLP